MFASRREKSKHRMDSIGANFLGDIDVTKYSIKKKSEQTVLSLRQETSEVVCKAWKSRKVDTCVSLYDVKEIRTGKLSKDFEKWTKELKKVECSRCFAIYYGTEFRLKTLSVASIVPSSNKKDADVWVKGLQYLIEKLPNSYLNLLDIWMLKEFEAISGSAGFVTLKQMRDFTIRVNYSISTGKLRSKYQEFEEGGKLNFDAFLKLTRDFLHDQQIFTDCFGKYALGSKIDLNGFQEFLVEEQNETKSSEYFPYFREFVKSGKQGIAYMNVYEAVDFLFSKQNQVWNKKYGIVYQDMTHPLSHYWIASSHNTYLTGDQVSSESSVEAYTRCLRMGCRCLELDCWDGPDGVPVIYHGRTLTTKISFLDVIKSIKEHAFATSEYPIILSIENHCSVSQQCTMAKKFQEVFGRMLVTQPVSKDEDHLPSPAELKGKIILKCKKLPKDEKAATDSDSTENEHDVDLCDTYKNGKMYIQGASNRWEPFFFALTKDKLIYTEIDEGREIEAERQDYSPITTEDLHFSKKWFHGKVPGGVKTAEERIKAFGIEGSFLVRQSDTFPGEFSLCFLSQDRAHHIRIKTNAEQSQFYLVPSKQFDSLYSLITHYRKEPLETKDFYIERFTKPVPQPKKHESQPWFYPNAKYPEKMTRTAAEDVLQKIPLNGAFLVRYAGDCSDEQTEFVISFRIENQIKHCRLKQDGRLLVVSAQRFENVEKLVAYYATHSFYKGLKLKHPVNEELMKFSQSVENPEKVYTSPDYLDTTVLTNKTRVRAIHAYKPSDPDCLSFEIGDIIINVVKQEGDWWKGDSENGSQVQKYFLENFVEEIEQSDSPFGELQKGSVIIGKTDIHKNNDDKIPCILSISSSSNPLVFKAGVTSMKEAKEWQEAINHKTKSRSSNILKIDKKEKKNKIAKEFSRLIVYCCTTGKLTPSIIRGRGRIFNEMTSYTELTAEKNMSADPTFYVWYHEVQFSRVYPKGQRVDSSNYNPIRFWNFGCQMVALNYQTGDKPMQLNHGKFRQNGGCGYVLRPEFMFRRNFNPSKVKALGLNEIKPLTFNVRIIAARHLSRSGNKAITKPYVEVEIVGADFDCQKVRTTKDIPDTGLNPFWNEKYTLKVLNPDLALIRFAAYDEDTFGDSHFLGQASYPARCLLQGFRSVPLENGFREELLSSMLIHLNIS